MRWTDSHINTREPDVLALTRHWHKNTLTQKHIDNEQYNQYNQLI